MKTLHFVSQDLDSLPQRLPVLPFCKDLSRNMYKKICITEYTLMKPEKDHFVTFEITDLAHSMKV